MILRFLSSNLKSNLEMLLVKSFRRFYSAGYVPKVCIIGSGPAGFYSAQHLIKNIPNIHIDIYERLPVPFGLVRFGVAPDHPEVKNVINTFTKTANHPNVRFIGNVNLGTDLSLQDLKDAYNIVLLSYGADEDRTLEVPGEGLHNVLSARRIVGWYNGLPSDRGLEIDLKVPSVVIIGQGNVAIDIARILLKSVDELKTTDITAHALEALSGSKIKKVYLVGRRGPLQAQFTIKELREVLKLKSDTVWNENDFNGVSEIVSGLARPRKRLTELMLSSLKAPQRGGGTLLMPKFYRRPVKFDGNDHVSRIILGVNKPIGDGARVAPIDEMEEVDCGLAIRSIGYRSVCVDGAIPFDEGKGVIVNQNGMVSDELYAAGWLRTGPTGVILTTMSNSFETAALIAKKLNLEPQNQKEGFDKIKNELKMRNKIIVTWKGWLKIDKYEQEIGKLVGKPREKLTDVDKMLQIGGGPV